MFVREKRIGAYTYIYLVETVREGARTRQRIIRNLGRKEEVKRRGDLDRLVRSAARLARQEHLAGDAGGGRAEDEALSILLGLDLLQAIEIGEQFAPFRLQACRRQHFLQVLAQDQREEAAEDVAADRGVSLVVDVPRREQGLGSAEQMLDDQ